MENKSEQYIHITKRGLLIIKNSEGTSYYFDPTNSLKDVATYIMSNPSLSNFISEPDKTNDEHHIIYVDPPNKEENRLRRFSPLKEDKYFEE